MVTKKYEVYMTDKINGNTVTWIPQMKAHILPPYYTLLLFTA
jgi:hypothetical protein